METKWFIVLTYKLDDISLPKLSINKENLVCANANSTNDDVIELYKLQDYPDDDYSYYVYEILERK